MILKTEIDKQRYSASIPKNLTLYSNKLANYILIHNKVTQANYVVVICKTGALPVIIQVLEDMKEMD